MELSIFFFNKKKLKNIYYNIINYKVKNTDEYDTFYYFSGY